MKGSKILIKDLKSGIRLKMQKANKKENIFIFLTILVYLITNIHF